MLLTQLNSDLLIYIIENNLQAGDKLPPLTMLSAEMKISVGKLREQLELARALNLVTVKPGAGTQINDYNFAAAVQPSLLFGIAMSEQNFEAYKSVRNAVVASFWEEASALLTSDDLAGLRILIASAWSKLNCQRISIPHIEHRTFHLSIFQRLDNPFVVGVEQAYWTAYEAVELNQFTDYQYLQEVWTYHERMLDFIEQQDYSGSKQMFVEHTTLLKHRLGV